MSSLQLLFSNTRLFTECFINRVQNSTIESLLWMSSSMCLLKHEFLLVQAQKCSSGLEAPAISVWVFCVRKILCKHSANLGVSFFLKQNWTGHPFVSLPWGSFFFETNIEYISCMKGSMKAAMNAESYYHFSIEKLKIRQLAAIICREHGSLAI